MKIAVFTWFLFPIAEGIVQGLLFKYKKGFGHVPGDSFYIQIFIIRGIAAILHGALVVNAQPGVFVPLFGFYACAHWLVFDVVLNLMRKKDIDYEGKNSGWLKNVSFKDQISFSIAGVIAFSYWLFKLGYV